MPPRSKVYDFPQSVVAELEARLIASGFGDFVGHSTWMKAQGCEISRESIRQYAVTLKRRRFGLKKGTPLVSEMNTRLSSLPPISHMLLILDDPAKSDADKIAALRTLILEFVDAGDRA